MATKKTDRQKQKAVKATDSLDALFLEGDEIQHDFNKLEHWPKWETGIPLIDFITDGGLPKARVVLCSGPPSSGKSTIYLKTAANVQKQGKFVVWIDAEGAFVGSYARVLGIDTEDRSTFRVVPSKSLEDTFDQILRFVAHPNMGLIVVDSIAYLMLKSQLENGVDDNLVGGIAKKLKHCLKLVQNKMDEVGSEATVCLVAQEYDAIGQYSPSGTTPKKVGGGEFAKYAASLHLDFRQVGRVMGKKPDLVTGEMPKNDVQVGTRIRCKVAKTRMTEPLRECQFVFVQGNGVDDVFSMVELANLRKLFNVRGGGWHDLPGTYTTDGKEKAIQTEAKVRDYFRENPDLYSKLEHDILTLIAEGSKHGVVVSEPRDPSEPNIIDLEEGLN
jgi:recombination protein RecA